MAPCLRQKPHPTFIRMVDGRAGARNARRVRNSLDASRSSGCATRRVQDSCPLEGRRPLVRARAMSCLLLRPYDLTSSGPKRSSASKGAARRIQGEKLSSRPGAPAPAVGVRAKKDEGRPRPGRERGPFTRKLRGANHSPANQRTRKRRKVMNKKGLTLSGRSADGAGLISPLPGRRVARAARG